MKWSEMKERVASQMASDPQRATLSTRAWKGVEEGLGHLAGAGYSFEIAPRGTLAELVACNAPASSPRSLTIEEASGMVTSPAVEDESPFEAQESEDA